MVIIPTCNCSFPFLSSPLFLSCHSLSLFLFRIMLFFKMFVHFYVFFLLAFLSETFVFLFLLQPFSSLLSVLLLCLFIIPCASMVNMFQCIHSTGDRDDEFGSVPNSTDKVSYKFCFRNKIAGIHMKCKTNKQKTSISTEYANKNKKRKDTTVSWHTQEKSTTRKGFLLWGYSSFNNNYFGEGRKCKNALRKQMLLDVILAPTSHYIFCLFVFLSLFSSRTKVRGNCLLLQVLVQTFQQQRGVKQAF